MLVLFSGRPSLPFSESARKKAVVGHFLCIYAIFNEKKGFGSSRCYFRNLRRKSCATVGSRASGVPWEPVSRFFCRKILLFFVFLIWGELARKMRKGRFPPFGSVFTEFELWQACLRQFLLFFNFVLILCCSIKCKKIKSQLCGL